MRDIKTLKTEKECSNYILSEIVSFLQKDKIKLTKFFNDGRLNSAKNEEEIINKILQNTVFINWLKNNNFEILTPNMKSNNNLEWYDFAIKNDMLNYFLPVNIKISNFNDIHSSADNLNCKLGIFYSLTGKLPNTVGIGNGIEWKTFFKLLDDNMSNISNNDKDYYFLIINKNNTNDIFFTSLKTLKSLVPNGNNLPFQCIWNNNRERISRTNNDAKVFILENFKKSIDKRDLTKSFYSHIVKHINTLNTDIS